MRAAALFALCVGAMMAFTSGSALANPTSGDCQNDSKLIGAIELSTDDRPGTWWYITSNGLEEAGFETDAEKLEVSELMLGTDFATLDDAVRAIVDAIRVVDKNGNNFVCASSVRGTLGFLPDPSFTNFLFSVIDDKHVK